MTRQVHPVADLFPMLEGEDFQALADDIAHRGLVHPIVLDTDGQVLDGRNRLAACQLAGVEPTFTTYTGDDPAGFVMASNITRRHLTKGQQAMLAARARAVSGKPLAQAASDAGVSKARVSYAATVLEHAPELAERVTAGELPLNDAYRYACWRKRWADPLDADAVPADDYQRGVREAVQAMHDAEEAWWQLALALSVEVDQIDAFVAYVREHHFDVLESLAVHDDMRVQTTTLMDRVVEACRRAYIEATGIAPDDPLLTGRTSGSGHAAT